MLHENLDGAIGFMLELVGSTLFLPFSAISPWRVTRGHRPVRQSGMVPDGVL